MAMLCNQTSINVFGNDNDSSNQKELFVDIPQSILFNQNGQGNVNQADSVRDDPLSWRMNNKKASANVHVPNKPEIHSNADYNASGRESTETMETMESVQHIACGNNRVMKTMVKANDVDSNSIDKYDKLDIDDIEDNEDDMYNDSPIAWDHDVSLMKDDFTFDQTLDKEHDYNELKKHGKISNKGRIIDYQDAIKQYEIRNDLNKHEIEQKIKEIELKRKEKVNELKQELNDYLTIKSKSQLKKESQAKLEVNLESELELKSELQDIANNEMGFTENYGNINLIVFWKSLLIAIIVLMIAFLFGLKINRL